ncbi:MAG: lipoyl(octanoyl) transferase [Planctomycetota bacterium]|nr:MAG: lipoyl(octanoyl) transferase [Planctomycetota bacterium]
MAFSSAAQFETLDLGRADYAEVTERMLQWVDARAAQAGEPDRLLLAEFEPVITVGRGASVSAYRHLEIPVYEVSRGGKATYHGPGQVVAYPLVQLQGKARDLHAYLHALEQALIETVRRFGLAGERDPRNTGCWVSGRKIASLGVAVRRWVTYHGVALNVSTDLSWFQRFDPCGLNPDWMTSMAEELAHPPALEEVKAELAARLEHILRA